MFGKNQFQEWNSGAGRTLARYHNIGKPNSEVDAESCKPKYHGEAIHPALLFKFVGWLSDGEPNVVAGDITAAPGTDEFSTPVASDIGLLPADVLDAEPKQSFSYR